MSESKIYTPYKRKFIYILLGLVCSLILLALGIKYFTNNNQKAVQKNIIINKITDQVAQIEFNLRETKSFKKSVTYELQKKLDTLEEDSFLIDRKLINPKLKSKFEHLKALLHTYDKNGKERVRGSLLSFIESDIQKELLFSHDKILQYSLRNNIIMNYYIMFCFFSSVFILLIFLPVVYRPLLNSLNELVENYEINENKLLDAQRIAEIGTWEYSTKHGEFYLSDQFMKLLDIDFNKKLTFEQFSNMIVDENRELFEESFVGTVNNGVNFDLELAVISSNDRYLWLRLKGKVLRQNEKIRTVFGTAQDISEKKTAENRFEKLFNQSSEAYVLYDDAGVVDCNFKAIDLLGFNDKFDMIRTHQATFSPLNQPDGRTSIEKEREMFNQAKEKGGCDYQWTLRKVNGELLPVDIHLTLINSGGKSLIISQWKGISDRIEFEKKTRSLKNKTQNIITTKIDFIITAIQKLYNPVKELNQLIESSGKLDKDVLKLSLDKFIKEFDKNVLKNFNEKDTPAFSFKIKETLEYFISSLSKDFKVEQVQDMSKFSRTMFYGGYINYKKSLNLICEYASSHLRVGADITLNIQKRSILKKFTKVQMNMLFDKKDLKEIDEFDNKLKKISKYNHEYLIIDRDHKIEITFSYVFESTSISSIDHFDYVLKGLDYNLKMLHFGNSNEWGKVSSYLKSDKIQSFHANNFSEFSQKLEMDYFDIIIYSSRDQEENDKVESLLLNYKESSYIGKMIKSENEVSNKKIEDFLIIQPINKVELLFHITQYAEFREGQKSTRLLKQEARKAYKQFARGQGERLNHIEEVLIDFKNYIPKVQAQIELALKEKDFHQLERKGLELLAVLENFDFQSVNEKVRLFIRISELEEIEFALKLFKQITIELGYFINAIEINQKEVAS